MPFVNQAAMNNRATARVLKDAMQTTAEYLSQIIAL